MDFGGGDFSAVFADDLEGVPVVWSGAVGDFLVDLADRGGVAEDFIDGVIELPRAIDIAHAVAFHLDAEFGEDLPEFAHVVIGHIPRATAGGGGIADGLADVLSEVFVFAFGDFVDGIIVIDAEKIAGGKAFFGEGAVDGIVNEHATEGADLDAS